MMWMLNNEWKIWGPKFPVQNFFKAGNCFFLIFDFYERCKNFIEDSGFSNSIFRTLAFKKTVRQRWSENEKKLYNNLYK